MNGKKVKHLKDMAALFFQFQPKGVPQKSVETIYNELKQVHKIKKNAKKRSPSITAKNAQ